MNAEIDELIRRATVGFKSDPGLREELGDELRSHLDSRIEELGGGEGAFIQAAEEFGDPGEMATSLVSANASRLQARSRMSFFTRRIVVPVSVIVAVFIGFQELRKLADYSAFRADIPGSPAMAPGWFMTLPEERIARGLDERERNIVFSQTGKMFWPGRDVPSAEKLWRSEPGNPAYYIAHLSALLDSGKPLPEDTIELGDQIDSGNGFYRYLVGLVDFEEENLERGYRWMQEAATMPRFRRYRPELTQERFKVLGRPQSALERTDHMWLGTAVPAPEFNKSWKFSAFATDRAKVLVEEGDREGLEELYNTWMGVNRLLAKDVTNLIEGLNTQSHLFLMGKHIVEPCRALGLDDKADELKAMVAEQREFFDGFWAAQRPGSREVEQFNKYAGLAVGSLSSAVGSDGNLPSGVELNPLRAADYIEIDRGAVSALVVILLITIGASAIIAEFKRRRHGVPTVFLLRLVDYGVILGVGILLPLCGYLLITRATGLGGHGVAVNWGFPVWALQLGAFSILALQLLAVTMRRRLSGGTQRIFLIERATFVSAVTAVVVGSLATFLPIVSPLLMVVAAGTLLLALTSMVLWWQRLLKSSNTDLARASIAVCGASILCITVVTIPLLNARERYWVSRDTIIPWDPVTGFSKIDREVTSKFRTMLIKVMKER